MKKCDICENEYEGEKESCEPCSGIISSYAKLSQLKLRQVLRSSYDSTRSEGHERYFKCFYTGISSQFNPTAKSGLDPVEDAFTLTIDHKNPGDLDSDLVVSLHIINTMKSKLSWGEFKRITIALAGLFSDAIKEEDFEKELKGTLQRG